MAQRRLQQIVLTSFVLAFACARLLVLLIMERRVPDIYLRWRHSCGRCASGAGEVHNTVRAGVPVVPVGEEA